MKTFKEIYEETVKNNGCNAGEIRQIHVRGWSKVRY